ncbi:MAG: CPBP family glutamic-type intramembrane protease [Candidatus Gracilibacteria bacterium]|jgi:membrane protease YdiL (CAAX protease family)
MKESKIIKEIIIFFLIALIFSMLLCRASIFFTSDHLINVLAYTLGIPISLLILKGFKSIKFESIKKNKKWLLIAILVPIIYTTILFLIGKYLIGVNSYSINQNSNVLYVTIFICASAFFEEIGWRGYLYKHLTASGWFKMNTTISILWASWHFPAIFYGGYIMPYPLWLSLILFFVNLTLASFILGWIRQKTGGVLAPTLIHASNNIGMIVTGISGLLIGETGILLTILLLAVILITKAWRPTRLFKLSVLKEKYIG